MKTIHRYIESCIRIMQNRQKYETAKTYRTVLNHLKQFTAGHDLWFADLAPEFLINFHRYLSSRGCCNNTCLLYFRQLQAIHRQAARQGIAPPPGSLYADLFSQPTPAVKRSIPAATLKQLRDAVLPREHEYLALARDLFLLSFYLRGIPYIDLAYLKWANIKDGILYYHRRKTGKALAITLEPYALEIINRWRQCTKGSIYLLPIIKNPGDDESERRQYESGLRLYNMHLKKLALVIGLPTGARLTSYTPRHTWANLAHEDGVELPFISEALSHSSEKTTRHYMSSFTADALATVNRRVVGIIDREGYGKQQSTKKRQKEGLRRVPVI